MGFADERGGFRGDEALAPLAPHRLDPGDPHVAISPTVPGSPAIPSRPGLIGSGEQPFERAGVSGHPHQIAGLGHLIARQPLRS